LYVSRTNSVACNHDRISLHEIGAMPHLLCNCLVLLSIFYSIVVEDKRVQCGDTLVGWQNSQGETESVKFVIRDGPLCPLAGQRWDTKIEVDKRKPSRELEHVSQELAPVPRNRSIRVGVYHFSFTKIFAAASRLLVRSRSFQFAARHSLTKAIRYVAVGGLVPSCGRCRLSWIV